ncbi:MAG: RNA polymerase sigma factor [Planctomycetes bacterium]|nr:RNA polymerase sigma factor [Planctomycetota bacterium]
MSRDDPTHADRLTQWVTDHGNALFSFLLVQLRDRHQAEDVLQDVFCRAWRAQGRYVDQGHERAYLWRIADRLLRDRNRRLRRQPPPQPNTPDEPTPDPIDPATIAPLEQVTLAEDQQHLASALEKLSEAQRRTLLLRYYGQLEFHEIAEIMELPLNTVLSHARRGLLALRGKLND